MFQWDVCYICSVNIGAKHECIMHWLVSTAVMCCDTEYCILLLKWGEGVRPKKAWREVVEKYCLTQQLNKKYTVDCSSTTTTSILWPFVWDYPGDRYWKGEPFWILLKQRWWVGMASAGPYASHLHFVRGRWPCQHCRMYAHALPAAQPTVSKHWRYLLWTVVNGRN